MTDHSDGPMKKNG